MKILKYLKISISIFVILCLFTVILTFALLWRYSPEIPSYEKIINYKPNLSSRIYSSDGLLLKSFFIQERIYIPIQRIPSKIKNAFISAEDKNFYNHYGVDFFAILRALITNIININNQKKLIGASTITQQVVKNLLLSNEVSYERKIKEIILAIRIENILNKDKILELYLNDIYLGYGSYGIGSASLNYFNKSINELDLHEIAFLAALPKAPNNYNPKKNYNDAINRRNWVINKMHTNGYISKQDLKYKKYPIETYKRVNQFFKKADYFYEETRKQLYDSYGKDKLYADGLIIKSTIDTKIQEIADRSLIRGIIDYDKRQGWRGPLENLKDFKNVSLLEKYKNINPFENLWIPVLITSIKLNQIQALDENKNKIIINLEFEKNNWLLDKKFKLGDVIFVEKIKKNFIIRQVPKVNGAIVVLNPNDGQILGLSGGYSFKISEFNRATQAKRQPGSAFKPFVYISALKENYTPSTLILDAPYVIDQGPGLPKWKPANYTEEFYGLTTMRTGIEKSRNLMTVRLADKIGMDKILNTAESFGISKYLNKQLSMALGSGLVTLIDLTNAYGIIANGGVKIEPKFIKSIYSRDGKKIYNSLSKSCENCKLKKISKKIDLPDITINAEQVVDPRIAYQITSMMEGVIDRGTAKKLKSLELTLAGKTGTTNENKDAWFIGYSPELVIGVYVGYDKPTSLGYKETGSSVAVPIFKYFVEDAKVNSNNIPFNVPQGINFVRIDSNTGLPSKKKSSIMEPFIFGSEPYNSTVSVLDSLGSIKTNSISGTGGLLDIE